MLINLKRFHAAKEFFNHTYDFDYQEIIQTESESGWRFVQMVPTLWDSHGRSKEIDLIFERPKDWEHENAKYTRKIV